jgi:two-component system sensor histidine kinase UhpB
MEQDYPKVQVMKRNSSARAPAVTTEIPRGGSEKKLFFCRARLKIILLPALKAVGFAQAISLMSSTNILVIDDDALLRRSIRNLLQTHRFNVIEAGDEEDGVRLAEKHKPELIVCDINMVNGDGYSTLERLRENPATALIPFILMTGKPSEEGMRRGLTRGADDYLEKPFSGETLLAAVHARLRKNQLLKQQAKETEARLIATLEATPDLVLIADRNRRCIYINHAGRKMLGIARNDDISSLGVREFVPPPAFDIIEREAVSALEKRGMWTGESVLSNRNSQETPVSLVVLANKTERGEIQFYSVNARDITERKQAEAALRETNKRLQLLSANLVNVQELERRHLARELHDEIGQALTAMKINLQAAQKSPDSTSIRLDESIAAIDGLLRQVRNLSLDLRPPLLDDLGLAAALRWYVDQLSQRTGIYARFTSDPNLERLAPTLETTCFRVAQEALTNVVRHSKAKNVVVKLEMKNDALQLSVCDDGIGFNFDAMRKRSEQGASLGLIGMEERVSLAGGALSINAVSGEGATILARFPVIINLPPAEQ